MNDVEKIKDEPAKYIIVLRDSLVNCHRVEDRLLYEKQLAVAAMMIAEVQTKFSLNQLKGTVAFERHSYGWSYLSDSEGLAAETAFHNLANLIETITGK